MKLAYLSNSALPSYEANSVQVIHMCEAFKKKAELTLFARRGEYFAPFFDFYGVLDRFPVVFSWFPNSPGRYWILALQSVFKSKFYGVQVAYCRCPFSALVAAKLGFPVFFEAHSFNRKDSCRGKLLQRLFACRSFKGLISITRALSTAFCTEYESLEEKCLVAADGAAVSPANRTRLVELKKKGRLCAGYVGQLYPGKGMEIILPLARACSWADFHVIGGTPELVNHWKAQGSDCANLVFHGAVPPASTADYIRGFDVVLAPYLRSVSSSGGGDIAQWTSPLKIFEYMAESRPIIASDLPVLREVLRPEENCLLCAPEDLKGWEAALTRLEREAGLKEKISQRANRDFLENYTWDKRAEKILNFISAKTALN